MRALVLAGVSVGVGRARGHVRVRGGGRRRAEVERVGVAVRQGDRAKVRAGADLVHGAAHHGRGQSQVRRRDLVQAGGG